MSTEQTPIKQNTHAARRKYHIIYKTTCLVTNKFYYGMHSTDDLNDGYLGSGSILAKSIRKHGKEAHVFEIVEHLPSREALSKREKEIITEELRKDPLCMNITAGGIGNYPGRCTSEETRQKLSIAMKGRKITWADKISATSKGRTKPKEAVEKHRQKMAGYKWAPEQIEARRQGQQNSEKFKERYRAVVINGVEYEHVSKAAEVLGISASTLGKRCNSRYFFEYQFKDSPKEFIEKIPHLSKALLIDGVEYANKSIAAKKLGMSSKMVYSRCSSDKYPSWQFKDPK